MYIIYNKKMFYFLYAAKLHVAIIIAQVHIKTHSNVLCGQGSQRATPVCYQDTR